MAVEIEQCQAENRQLRAIQEEEAKSQRNRIALIHMLREMWESGDQLYTYKHPPHDLKDWEDRTGKLVEMALGDHKRRDFLKPDPDYARWSDTADESEPVEQIRMRCLLDRLRDLIRQANRFTPPPLQLEEDFDVQEYQKWLAKR